MAPRYALSVSLLCLTMAGCACVATEQDWLYKLAQHQRAGESYRSRYSPEQRKCHSCDFYAGFKRGYFETSIGRDCRVPAVAPPKYWTAHYQSCEGQEAVQDWFRGYQDGIAAASADGYRYFNEVPVSAQAPVVNRTACGMCQSWDPCNCRTAPNVMTPDYPVHTETILSEQPPVNASSGANPNLFPALTSPEPATAGSAQSSSDVGLIGGLGALKPGLVGPMDQAVLQN